jgi:hypothetical protein
MKELSMIFDSVDETIKGLDSLFGKSNLPPLTA